MKREVSALAKAKRDAAARQAMSTAQRTAPAATRVCVHCLINRPIDQWGSVCEQCWQTAPNYAIDFAHSEPCPCWRAGLPIEVPA